MSILKDTTVTFFTRIGIFLIQGISALLLARLLGPEGRGLYALIITVPHIAAMVCNFGLGASTVYFVSKGEINKERILAIIYFFPLLIGLFVILFLYFFSNFYIQIYPEVPIDLFQQSLILIPVIAFFNNNLAFLQGEKRFTEFNIVNSMNPSVFFVSMLILIYMFNFQLLGAILSWQLGFILAALLGMFFITRRNRFDFSVNKNEFFSITKYSSRISISEILTFLNYRLDIFLVGIFLDAKAVGWYTVAVVIAETIWFLANSIASVLFPNFSERKVQEAQNLFRLGFAFIFWMTLMGVILLNVIDYFIIDFAFGTDFLPSLKALQYLYPGVLLLSLYKILSSYIASQNKPGIIMRIAFIGVVVNVLLNLIFIPQLGISGAAISSSVAYGLMFLAGFIWFQKNSQISISSLFLIRKNEFKNIVSWFTKTG